MPCDCPESQQLTRLKTWLRAEIQYWKFKNEHEEYGLTELGAGALAALEMTLRIAEEPSRILPFPRRPK